MRVETEGFQNVDNRHKSGATKLLHQTELQRKLTFRSKKRKGKEETCLLEEAETLPASESDALYLQHCRRVVQTPFRQTSSNRNPSSLSQDILMDKHLHNSNKHA
jgi:hypothetical protein